MVATVLREQAIRGLWHDLAISARGCVKAGEQLRATAASALWIGGWTFAVSIVDRLRLQFRRQTFLGRSNIRSGKRYIREKSLTIAAERCSRLTANTALFLVW